MVCDSMLSTLLLNILMIPYFVVVQSQGAKRRAARGGEVRNKAI